jgi:glucose-6-phosphate 1-dehydrogenase
MSKTIFILFGCSGDIYQKKVFYNLYHLFLKNEEFICLGLARRNMTDNEFNNLILDSLKKETTINPEFLNNFDYKKVDYENRETYINIEKFIQINYNKGDKIIYYFGLPAFATLNIIGKLKTYNLNKNVYMLIEKPFGNCLNQFIDYCRIIDYNQNNMFFIDHYKPKKNLLKLKHNSNKYITNKLKKINISIFEKHDVNDRTGYFEEYGLINDMFQSHILVILQYLFGDNFYLKQIPFVKNLQIKQYYNYPIKNSNTETYFDLDLVWNNIDINIICGKKMNKHTRIINFEYLDGSSVDYDFDDTFSHDYLNIFMDIIKFDGNNMFINYEDNINFWNITNNVILYKKKNNLSYY